VTTRSQYRVELQNLERTALGALDLIVQQVERVTEALEQQDVELGTFVIADDDRVDGRYLEVNQGVLSLFALQAPVAGDLRLVASLLHVAKHFERMGDQCVNIAKLIPLTGNDPPRRREVLEPILRMGVLARDEVVQARQALGLRDVDLALDIVRRDQELNELNREVFRLAIQLGDDIDTREWLMTMTMVARAFERIGDNAVDIGEQVAFVVEGAFPEFGDRTARLARAQAQAADIPSPGPPPGPIDGPAAPGDRPAGGAGEGSGGPSDDPPQPDA
jgi:phosphate transport system protein